MAKNLKHVDVKAGRIADVRIVKNMMNLADVKRGRRREGDEFWYALRVQMPDGSEHALLVSQDEMARAMKRARDNPEDVPEVGKMRDLLD